jgi:hypothetical protein
MVRGCAEAGGALTVKPAPAIASSANMEAPSHLRITLLPVVRLF